MNMDVLDPRLICFKYRSGDAALRCLAESTLYFAKPNELNDILEAKFDHAAHEDFGGIFERTLSEVSLHRGGPALAFDQNYLPDLVVVSSEENERFRVSCDELGIFSAARRPDHQAMWAYYAENCQGVCFELEWTPSILSKNQILAVDVTYSHEARVHNRAEDWRSVFLDLAEKNPRATVAELQELSLEEPFRRRWGILTTARAASVKHSDWAHESEIRLMAPRSGARLVLADVLKRVHFIRTDGAKWINIMQELYANYPAVELVCWTIHHGLVTSSGQKVEFKLVPADKYLS